MAEAIRGGGGGAAVMHRSDGVTALLLSILFATSLIIWTPPADAASGTVITDDTTWSGYNEISGDVTVIPGKKLVLEPGTILNMTEDSILLVEGVLEIRGSASNPSSIYGSHIAPTSHAPRWEGIQVGPSGDLTVQTANVSDARGGFHVLGSMDVEGAVNVHNTTIGYFVEGSMTITGGGAPTCTMAGYACMRVEGSLTSATLGASGSGAVLSVGNGGTATVTTLTGSDVGNGIEVGAGGTVDIETATFTDAMTGVSANGAVSVDIETIDAIGDIGTGLDMTDVSGVDIAALTSSSGSWGRVLRCVGVDALSIGEIEATGLDDGRWAIECDAEGNATISGGSLSGYSNGVQSTGSGTLDIGALNVSASGVGVSASGTGSLVADGGNWSDAETLASISSATSNLASITLYGGSTSAIGIEYITGSHALDGVTVSRPYVGQDRTSIGIRAHWSDLTLTTATLTGWHRGLAAQQDATVSATTLSSTEGGRDEGASVSIEDGSMNIGSLTTGSAENGVRVDGGSVHVADWSASGHRQATLSMSDDASATIRDLPLFATVGTHDAFGDGTLLWGSDQSGERIAVTNAEALTESTITVTDLGLAAVVGATVTSHGYSDTSDSSGEVTLPLLANGSEVRAVASDGTGTTQILTSPSDTIQLPIIPSSGNWTISSGIDAELHGSTFVLPGNLTIESGASLSLIDATLTLPSYARYVAEGNGELLGDGGTVSGGSGEHTAVSHPYGGSGDGLTVLHTTEIACSSQMTMSGVHFRAAMTLGDGCMIRVFGGIHDTVTLGSGAEAEVISGLQLRVLDKGTPVEGASVLVQGQNLTTDATGVVTTSAQAKVVHAGGTNVAGTLAILIVHSGISTFKAWDTSHTVSMDVMVSTLAGGAIDSWTRVDAEFSPYHLGSDLTVPDGKTLQLLPGAALTLSNGASIHVQGMFEMDDATLSGSDWGALRVNGTVDIDGGQVSGGGISVEAGGDATLNDVLVTGSEVSVTGAGAEMSMQGGQVMQTTRCLRAASSATLTLAGVTLSDCSQHGAWVTDATLEATSVMIGAGTGTGMWLQGASGNVTDLNASAHDGGGAVLRLDAINSLVVSGGTMRSGGSSAAIVVDHSDAFDLRDSTLLGSPALLVEESAGTVSGLTLDGEGANGSGIEIMGSTSKRLALHEVDVDGHSTSISMRGSIDDVENPPVETSSCHFHGTTSIDVDGLPFMSTGDTLDGILRLDATDKRFIGALIDSTPASIEIDGNAILWIGVTRSLQIVDDLAQEIQGATAEISIASFNSEIDDQSVTVSSGSNFVVYHEVRVSGDSSTSSSGWFEASASGHLPSDGAFALGSSVDPNVRIVMQANDPPTVVITSPDASVNQPEGENLSIRAAATDPDPGHAAVLTYAWYLTGIGDTTFDTPILSDFEGEVFIEQGEWTLWVVVSDPVGENASDSVAVTISAPDNDRDSVSTCTQDGVTPWYDFTEMRHCGPDQWDLDDDNDGWKDDQDAFPFDACAARDTDDDGMPDAIVEGCTSSLTADDDDDGDGILDAYDPLPTTPGTGAENAEAGIVATFLSPAVILPLLVAIAVIAFLVRQRLDEEGTGGSGQGGSTQKSREYET